MTFLMQEDVTQGKKVGRVNPVPVKKEHSDIKKILEHSLRYSGAPCNKQ